MCVCVCVCVCVYVCMYVCMWCVCIYVCMYVLPLTSGGLWACQKLQLLMADGNLVINSAVSECCVEKISDLSTFSLSLLPPPSPPPPPRSTGFGVSSLLAASLVS